jgi:hypothetical protein
MPNILVRGVPLSLLAQVNYRAKLAELTQNEWVLDALARAVDHELDQPERMDVRVQHPPRPEPAPIPERPGEHPCPECGVYMVRNEKLRQWECPSCHFIDRKKF